MRLTWQDAAGAVIVAGLTVPFIGYMVTGSMPGIQDPTGMAGVAIIFLILGTAMCGWIAGSGIARVLTAAVALASLVLALLALSSENILALPVRHGLLIGVVASVFALWTFATLHGPGAVARTPAHSA